MESININNYPPLTIKANDFILKLKDKKELLEGLYSYRCKFRKICSGLFHIKKEDIDLYINSKICNCNIFKTYRDHSIICLENNKIKSENKNI